MKHYKKIISITLTSLLSFSAFSVLAESIIFNPRATITYKLVSNSMQPVGSQGVDCYSVEDLMAGNPDTKTLFKDDKTTGKPTTTSLCTVNSDDFCNTAESVAFSVPVFNTNHLKFKDMYYKNQPVCEGFATFNKVTHL